MFRRIRGKRDHCLKIEDLEEIEVERTGTCPSESVLLHIAKGEGRDKLGALRWMTTIQLKIVDTSGRSSNISKVGQFRVNIFAPHSFTMMLCSDNG
jgi:hypothetical protein